MANQEEGPCAYCGSKTSNTDQYGLCCSSCNQYWKDHPTYPTAYSLGLTKKGKEKDKKQGQ